MPIVYTITPESDAIDFIGYDTATTEMRIAFRNKNSYPEYIWGGIDKELIERFLFAASKGSFYHNNIKGRREFRVRKAIGSFRVAAFVRGARRRVFSTR